MIHSQSITVSEKAGAYVIESAAHLRASEKLALGFLAYAVVASVVFPLSLRERLTVQVLNLVSASVVLVLSGIREEKRTGILAILRDWFPCVLILLAYRESGLFFVPDPTHRLDYLFFRLDTILLKHRWVVGLLSACSSLLQRYFEFSYLLCYPLVPLGLGSLVVARRWGVLRGSDADRSIDHFWTAVLLALFFCYIVYPLFPLTPPRSLFHDFIGPPVRPFFRKMNFWILGQYGVEACIFPSGHVAAVTATALAVRSHLPRVGVVFLILGASVVAATVFGRYHYAADAVAGAFAGAAAIFISNRMHHKPRALRRIVAF